MPTLTSFTTIFLILITLHFQRGLGQPPPDEQFIDCPADIFDDFPTCLPADIYYFKVENETCQVTVSKNTTNCNTTDVTWALKPKKTNASSNPLSGRGGWFNPKLMQECKGADSVTVISSDNSSNSKSNCYSYTVPICQDGNYELIVYSVGGPGPSKKSKCSDITINNQPIRKALYSNMLKRATCPRTEITVNLKVGKSMTEVKSGKSVIPMNGSMSVEICLNTCGETEDNLAQMQSISIARNGGHSVVCDDNIACERYNGTIPSLCWAKGCQYYPNGNGGAGRCGAGIMSCETKLYKKCVCSHSFCDKFWPTDDCSKDVSIFSKALNCRRANTYYVYHPKIHCLNEVDTGDCSTATSVYAVNLNGIATTDQRGISYIAGNDSKFQDPHNSRRLIRECEKIVGVTDKNTEDLYATAVVGHPLSGSWGKCLTYPVPICLNGGYMLTIKMTEGHYKTPNEKCTEVRINNVPIMLDLDPFTLSGNKQCGTADVVFMFMTDDGDDNNPLSARTLWAKGHAKPIPVVGGKMELQFCYGYACFVDNNYLVSAFSLERLGPGTKPCALK